MKTRSLVVALLVLGVLATGWGIPGSVSANQSQTVVFGLPSMSVDFLPIYVAAQKGYLQEVGINPEIIHMDGGPPVITALTTGDIDVAALGIGSAVLLHEKAVPIQYIMAFNNVNIFSLMASPRSGIQSVEDLKGKSIAVLAIGALDHLTAKWVLEQHGLDAEADVSFLPAGGGLVAAIKAGRAEATFALEPFIAILEIEGLATEILDVREIMQDFIPGGLVVTAKWANENPELVEKLHQAVVRGLEYIFTDREGTFEIARQTFDDMSMDILQASFDRYYPTFVRDGKVTPTQAQFTQEFYRDLGVVDRVYPYEEIIHPLAR